MPDPTSGPDMPPPPDPPALPSEEHMPARPAWRTVQRSTRRIHRPRPDQPPPPEPAPEPTRQPLHSWISWQPSPALAPTPPSIEPILLVAGRSPGLFGPRLPLEPDVPLPPDPSAPPSEGTYDSLLHSWITSQSNLALVPTPPSIEPILLVPGGSPGLFGPRSPREPYAPLPPDPSSPPLEEYMPARPVWRTVPRGTRRIRKPRPDQPPPPEPAPEPTRQPMHSWITWQPNPALAPTPPSIEPILLVPGGSPGLFGPRSPREPDVPPPPDPSSPPLEEHMPSQSNPALAPTPPSIEPILLVAGGSPGLFGPRSPLEPDVPPPLDPLALPPEEHMPARPVWRNPRSTRRVRNPRPDQPPHLEPAPEPTGQSSDSWITWQPNPALAPTPPSPLSPCNSLRVLSPNND